MIAFNQPPYIGTETDQISKAIGLNKISGGGYYTNKCHNLLEEIINTKKALLTTSCTHALEMSAILADIKPGDEVIMPSYTFVSTANAFVLRGAKIVFVDIRSDTMNIDEKLIEDAITSKTRAIVPVHYAGVSCEMDEIMDIAKKYGLSVIEDSAQAIGSLYKGRPCGTFGGELSTLSFHETKNITCGEGGALLINNEIFFERSEIIREKGTNRSRFFRGEVDKYSWCDIGSSYLPSELNAAYLAVQLENMEKINSDRMVTWHFYRDELAPFVKTGFFEISAVPEHCTHNAHMFYIKLKDLEKRTKFISYMKKNGVLCVFHYIPLHSSEAGLKFGRFHGSDIFTTRESERLVRLPMYYNMRKEDREKVVEVIKKYVEEEGLL